MSNDTFDTHFTMVRSETWESPSERAAQRFIDACLAARPGMSADLAHDLWVAECSVAEAVAEWDAIRD